MMLARVASVAALIWGTYWWIDHRGYKRGVATEVARQAKVIAEANRRIAKLNAELDVAQAALDTSRAEIAAGAVGQVVDKPQCVKSECGLPADVIKQLNRIE
jgi:hypothetical protein